LQTATGTTVLQNCECIISGALLFPDPSFTFSVQQPFFDDLKKSN
jgi:hypothetical protein